MTMRTLIAVAALTLTACHQPHAPEHWEKMTKFYGQPCSTIDRDPRDMPRGLTGAEYTQLVYCKSVTGDIDRTSKGDPVCVAGCMPFYLDVVDGYAVSR